MLKIINFTHRFGDKVAVDNLNLSLDSGDLCAFVGHNGAGKSTTIKAIVGILEIQEGEIFVDDKKVSTDSLETKKIISYVPDNPDLYDSLKGIDYLNFVADAYSMGKEREQRILSLASRLGLEHNLNDFIATYSHGMKQKLSLISAFMHDAKLIVLDEPFVGLDPVVTFEVKEMMKEFCEAGGAIFFSTHVLEVAEKLCNKIAIIKNGSLIRSGSMEEVIKDSSLEDVFMELERHG